MHILHDPETLKHKTVELLGAKLIPALESPQRIEKILEAIRNDNSHSLDIVTQDPASQKRLEGLLSETHDAGYVRHLRDCHSAWVEAGHIKEEESILPECFPAFAMPHYAAASNGGRDSLAEPADIFARSGFYAFDMSTGIMKDTYSAALASANLAVDASQKLVNDPSMTAIVALCRPPGHHCDAARAGGYCYLNNAVLAATSLLSSVMPQAGQAGDADLNVAILDIDMHHGNGTQSFFYHRKVKYVSIHGKDEYPYFSGKEDETGSGEGLGYNSNFPLAQKASEKEYLATLETALGISLRDSPKYLVVSLGFDTFHLDPLGGFDLDAQSYTRMGKLIAEKLVQTTTRTAILLEGGYVIEHLGKNLLAFLSGWSIATPES